MDPIAAMILAGIGIALGLANFINGTARGEVAKTSAQEIKDELKQLNLDMDDVKAYIGWARGELENILAGEKVIEAGLKEILAAVNWNAVVTEIAEPVERVQFLFEEMTRVASGSDSDRQKWISAVLAEDLAAGAGGLRFALSAIHGAIMGNPSLGTQPLLAIFADKIRAQPKSTSTLFLVLSYLRTLVEMQSHGYAALLNALVWNGSTKDQEDVIAQMKARYSDQKGTFAEVVKNCSPEYHAPLNPVAPRFTEWMPYVPSFVVIEMQAPPGKCIVGITLDSCESRLHSRDNVQVNIVSIAVAEIKALLFEEAPQVTWIGNLLFLNEPTVVDWSAVNLVDLTEMVVPSDCVVTGLGFRVVEANRVSLSIRPAKVTDAGLVQGDWISNDKADNVARTSQFTFLDENNKVTPTPVWPLSGFAFYDNNGCLALETLPASPGLREALAKTVKKTG
ncbi:MAG: hypothetical protein ACREC9_07860 [Methylocella sp.]